MPTCIRAIFLSAEHPEDPQYIGIDCGIVGSLNKEDKRYLAENFIAFFNRDYRKVAELHVDSGWVPRIPMLKSSSLLFVPSASRSLKTAGGNLVWPRVVEPV
jgi:hypothetical protein